MSNIIYNGERLLQMVRYSDELLDEIKSKNDIVDIVSQYVVLKRTGRNYMGLCPFHKEKSGSFCVSPDKQIFHCFGCGVGGNVFTFIMEYENMSFPEAVQYLADKAGMTLPESNQSGQDASREKYKILLRDMNKTAAAYFHYIMRHTEHGKKAYEYFKGRGLSDETINQFGLGYADIYRDDLYRYLKGLRSGRDRREKWRIGQVLESCDDTDPGYQW